MSTTPFAEQIPHLATLGNVVPEGYQYYEKVVTAGQDVNLPSAYLKWYDLYPESDPITADQRTACRQFVESEVEQLKLKGELGFVILHRAGSVLLLLLTTWRNTNEMWESVYFKDLASTTGYLRLPVDGEHRGTYCVWELGIVWHERHAWVRFLSSARDNAAKLTYIHDRFAGRV